MRRFFLGFALAIAALAPAVGHGDDRQIAEFIKGRLQAEQQAGRLKGFTIDMSVEEGVVWMKGFVSTPEQEMLVLRAAQEAGRLGAVKVVDEVEVRQSAMPMAQSPVMPAHSPQMGMDHAALAGYQEGPMAIPANFGAGYNPGYNPTPVSQPMTFHGQAPLPLPMGSSGGETGMIGGSPHMPGYAWPGYAAHPNYAAVTYPRQYSPSAWPYIGPFYPYPQVPLGWRRVELQWDDGWWYLDFKDR
ncbi:MAG TPA: BON domain-containing protein [Pirellulaceae bacterium]|nr:BON domain-containing protein [Pirellulaceae bacterium]